MLLYVRYVAGVNGNKKCDLIVKPQDYGSDHS